MENVSLNLSVEELSRINNNIKYTKAEMENLLKSIGNKYCELANYIQTTEIFDLLQRVETNIISISTKTNENFDLLTNFLDGQIIGYKTVVQDAVNVMQEALSFIEENFVVKS